MHKISSIKTTEYDKNKDNNNTNVLICICDPILFCFPAPKNYYIIWSLRVPD